MSVVSKPTTALHRKRLAGALAAVSLCLLVGACGNDDHASDTSTTSSTDAAADNGGASQVLSANPSASSASPAASALPALTIQTPALPASSADAALSAAASTPLVAPVIHTAD
ncbi:hypothetical protein [Paraburkholderia fungorum]|uniref:hypothetical protein n=1 Tax=Paraburkholderia fungorum TaxID=134537 RepID=UPI000E7784A8|nr:hypothetical protein [Paraburkholderia fungorum]